MTHSPGAIRAARCLVNKRDEVLIGLEGWARIIDEETHLPELVDFIERVAAWDFVGDNFQERFNRVHKEAFELIKKVRGL